MGSEREPSLIQETLATWQAHYPNPLSEADAQQIITSTTALFNLLAEWDEKSKLSA